MMIKFIVGLLAMVAFLLWVGVRIYTGVQYDMHIGDYVLQAATSPTPSVAAEKLDTAISEIERQHLTSGNTGIFFTYPTNDVGFWYKRLVDSRAVLSQLPASDSALEISNTMMRVHQSISGSSQDGAAGTAPEGISIFPHNAAFFWWGLLSFLTTIVSFVLAAIKAGS